MSIMVAPLVLQPHPTLVLLMLNPAIPTLLCKMQVALIEQTDQAPLSSHPVAQNESTSALFPGKFYIAFDQPTSITSSVTIATAADSIFVPVLMYAHVFFKQSNESAQQVLKNGPTVSSLEGSANVMVPITHPSMYKQCHSNPSLKRTHCRRCNHQNNLCF